MEVNSDKRQEELSNANRKTSRKLFVVAVLMFGFGYALIPLYSVLCKVTGINGKTETVAVDPKESLKVDKSRTVIVEFTGLASTGLPWEFKPAQIEMKVHPGEVKVAKYIARNYSAEQITGQASPSVSPNKSARHFKKLACFCFTSQTLAAGETKEMPVRFYVDTKLPKDVSRITLSYTFYNKDSKSTEKYSKSDHVHASLGVNLVERFGWRAGQAMCLSS